MMVVFLVLFVNNPLVPLFFQFFTKFAHLIFEVVDFLL
jgi:hypothetical protein